MLDAVSNAVLDEEPVGILFELQLVGEEVPPGVPVGVVSGHQSADGFVRGTGRNGLSELAEPIKDRGMHLCLFFDGRLTLGPLVASRSNRSFLATDGILHKGVSRVLG